MMIKVILLWIFFVFSPLAVNSQDNRLASCCDSKPKNAGRCTGSAYCSACSNCSRCAHCSGGGSCGVCASYSAPVRYTAPRAVTPAPKSSTADASKKTKGVSFVSETSVKSKTKKQASSPKAVVVYHPEHMVAVGSEILVLREEAGNEYAVLETLKKDALLMVIAVDGEWLQVKVVQSGNYGYVKAGFVYKK